MRKLRWCAAAAGGGRDEGCINGFLGAAFMHALCSCRRMGDRFFFSSFFSCSLHAVSDCLWSNGGAGVARVGGKKEGGWWWGAGSIGFFYLKRNHAEFALVWI